MLLEGKKKVYGNPYCVKNLSKVKEKLTIKLNCKASGQLEITIDVEANIAKSLKNHDWGCRCFSFLSWLKGLAYVSEIRLR